ncbi:MAG: uroporphyrinogen-III synthase, partial [Synergistaceae bacterium]|nr:uroporphyrinogen-III synthase [Synergistaceae bacterium]
DSLKAHGLHVDYVPNVFDASNLAEGLSHLGGRILMMRAVEGTKDINETFRKYGISYEEICIYRTDYVELKHVPKFADIIIFTSASTVRGFTHNISGLRDVVSVCIGIQTAGEARREGFTRIKIAERATVKSLFEAVMSCS